MSEQGFSDATQLATIRVARASVSKDHGLTEGERQYHLRVLDCIGDRIEDAMARKKAAANQRSERQK